ncbi:hypothetical protein KP509_02G031000 [Ceratopteris richardii]|nr:hypothetical protein KP509_02G031000 [Ceratopteris richardii]KAH7443361.1 hypothetical protein KP509_02G031000 [Ceratopteris richardii]KAH7443364.1 hypothetical protein KP509_02G031000 [Ceratopteris richardii]KAH7443365.1 hypothetical protein KP509_02G031000 [Ceratopteris richardii]
MAALIEGLPDAVALQILARVPLSCHPSMRAVNHAWRSHLYSEEFFKLREKIGSSEEWLYVSAREPDRLWQAFDPYSERWFSLPPLPSPVKYLSNFGTAALGGKIYVIGGGSDDVDLITGDRGGVAATNEVWVYDPIHREWQEKAPMLMARAQFACCVLDGCIVVAGGFTHTRQFIATAEIYDPHENTWKSIANLCQTMNSPCSGAVLEGKVYVIHKEVPLTQVYDASHNKWMVVDCFLSQGPMGTVNGELYVIFNGIVSREHTSPALKRTICSWPSWYRRVGFGVAGLKGELYVVGGVTLPRQGDHDLEPLQEVWICRVDGEWPCWRPGVSMTLSKGTVVGCVVLRL